MSVEPIYDFLTDDGLTADGTNENANVNGAVTAVPFYRGPPTGEIWAIHRMIVEIEDNATFTADNYGGVSTLTNGVELEVREGTTGALILDVLDSEDITSIADWAAHCYDMTEHTFGSGNNFAVARFTFANAGRPIVLDGDRGEVLIARVNDDLSGLVNHKFMIQGHQIPEHNSQLKTWGA
jgi:hypothetical protein